MIVDATRNGCLLALIILFAAPASANPPRIQPAAQEVVIGHCIREAAGGRAWLEQTLWALRDQEGGWIGAEIANANGTHDLGPLQINSFWIPKLSIALDRPTTDVRAWLIRNPCFNVQAAKWIFLNGLIATRDYWKAVGVYHSPTSWRQRKYAASVSRHLINRFGSGVFGTHRSKVQQ